MEWKARRLLLQLSLVVVHFMLECDDALVLGLQ
jgi:hypothetical protein